MKVYEFPAEISSEGTLQLPELVMKNYLGGNLSKLFC